MAVPKQHRSSSRRDQRRMHLFLRASRLISCKNCAKQIMPHQACPFCGMYRGRQAVDVMAQLAKKEKKVKQKQASA